jgi:predicted small secreted protein
MKKIILLITAVIVGTAIANAQNTNVGIGTNIPDSSARLDVKATNKGVLLPRVSLQSGADATTVPAPAHSLMVYNMNDLLIAPDGSGKGYYYNAGTPSSPKWVRIASGTTSSARYIGPPDDTKTVVMGDFEFRYSASGLYGNMQMRRLTTAPDRAVNALDVAWWTTSGNGVTAYPSSTVSTAWVAISQNFGAVDATMITHVSVPATNDIYRVTCTLYPGISELLMVEKF